MKLLAFDTSSHACSVALLNTEGSPQIISQHLIAPMQHAKLILSMIEEVLSSASLTRHQLDAIAFGQGPGSFTGTRIASSVAQGLGLGLALPVIGVSSLAALAQAALLEKNWPNSLVAVDARMGQLYWAAYQARSDGIVELIGEERLCAPHAINKPLAADWYGIGDAWKNEGATLIAALGFAPVATDSNLCPSAEAVAMLAKKKYERGEWGSLSSAVPTYLR